MLSECLGDSSMRLGVPFIAPRQLGAVGGQLGRPNLPFCRVVHYRTVTGAVRCAISFLFQRIQPLVLGDGWRTGHCPVHTGQSGVPNRPLLRATRRPRIARPTVGAGDRWLTGQSGAPPDSPVNYSRTPPSNPESGEFTRTGLAHRTVRCAKLSWSLLHIANSFSNSFLTVSST
jgi:hypothetical protein